MDSYKRLNYYRIPAKKVLEQLNSSAEGLSAAEARKRLREYGANSLPVLSSDGRPDWLYSLAMWILGLCLAGITASLFVHQYAAAVIMAVVAGLNAALLYVASRFNNAVLRDIAACGPADATVRRHNKVSKIAAAELVLGDIVLLGKDDIVPADLRLISVDGLITNNEPLMAWPETSQKVSKTLQLDTPLAERHNLAFAGTTVAAGEATGVVIATGQHTELGRILFLSQAATRHDAMFENLARPLLKWLVCGASLLVLSLLLAILFGRTSHQVWAEYTAAACAALLMGGLIIAVSAGLKTAANRLGRFGVTLCHPSAAAKLSDCSVLVINKICLSDVEDEELASSWKSLAQAGTHVIVMSETAPATTKSYLAKSEFWGDASSTILTGSELEKLADSQVAELMHKGNVAIARASADDALRLIQIAKHAGRRVATVGKQLSDIPAMLHADVGFTVPAAPPAVLTAADAIANSPGVTGSIAGSIKRSRTVFAGLQHVISSLLTDSAALFGIMLVSLLGIIYLHIPLAITAAQILLLTIVVLAGPAIALVNDKPPRRAEADTFAAPSSTWFILRRPIGFGLLAAVLCYLVFVYFFVRRGLNPEFIDSTSLLNAQATSLTVAAAALCQMLNLLFIRADRHKKFFAHHLTSNKPLLAAFGLALLLLALALYARPLQHYFHTTALSVGDWLTAVIAAGVYTAFRLAQRHTRKHSRHEVIKLHREVHGPHSPARI
jgi:magnesium-transporting ATPase (P-type)